MCRGVVEVEDRQIDIIGFDQMASPLASILPGTVVSGEGILQKHEWTVGDGGKREALVIELDSITSWQRAERL
jgi:single-stranded DNA-binding protein